MIRLKNLHKTYAMGSNELHVLKGIDLNIGAGDGSEFFKNPEVSLTVAATALAVLIVTGALAGLIPAKRVVSIKPVEAIRNA